eukprot:15456857-Alexandrium_andersonii.AAC.1
MAITHGQDAPLQLKTIEVAIDPRREPDASAITQDLAEAVRERARGQHDDQGDQAVEVHQLGDGRGLRGGA